MSGLNSAKHTLLRGLFASVSDVVLKNLEGALSCGAGVGGALAEVHALAHHEVLDRRGRDLIFAPLAPLSRPDKCRLPSGAVAMMWRALRVTDSAALTATVAATLDRDQAERAAFRADALLNSVAERLSTDDGAVWDGVRTSLEAQQPGAVGQVVELLRIAPLIRAALPRLGHWVRAMDADDASALRLTYRDASEMEPPMGPLLITVLAAHLQHPWQVLRLLSAVMDRPSDAYLASSELGGFGEAVLDDLDARIVAVGRFDPGRGAEGGAAAAASVMTAAMQAVEFEQWIAVNRNSQWGRRLVHQRRDLARTVETRLREAQAAVARALPTIQVREGGRTRACAQLDEPFDVDAARCAQGLLAFLDGVRTCANFGGFAVVRGKVIETLDAWLDYYAEELIAVIQSGDASAEAARERLDFAAECLGQVRDPATALLLRRRAAVAA